MNLHVLKSVEAQMRGVMGRDFVGDDDLFVFTGTHEGAGFHMQTVPFDISIAFLDRDYGILEISQMKAETGGATAPHGSVLAVEASPDYFERHGLKSGDVWKALWTKSQQGEL